MSTRALLRPAASETHLAQLAWALCALAVGYAVQLSNGNLHPDAINLLTTTLVLGTVAAVSPRIPGLERALGTCSVVFWVAGAGLIFQLGNLLTAPPGIYLQLRSARDFLPFHFGIAAMGVLAASALTAEERPRRLLIPLLLVVHFVLGVWLIRASPNPFIDVYVFQRDSLKALLSGQNPYAITFPDIYGNSPFYGPGLSVGGRLTFGFPYPPLSLLLALPGHLFGGDYRYSQLVAMTAAGGLMAYARPGRVGVLAAALFLTTPRFLFVLEQGWTEPFAVLLLAAVLFAACRAPRALPWAFGLLIAVKQYTLFIPPLVVLLLPRPLPPKRELFRMAGKAVGIAAAVTLPLALWNFPAFWRDTMALQFVQPFRTEALSYLAWFARDGSAPLPTSLAFVAAAVAVVVALWRSPRAPAGFAGAVALAYTGFFAFNKQAFCNYYFFVIGAFCCALAVSQSPSEPRREDT